MTFGQGCYIAPSVVCAGRGEIKIGKYTEIRRNSTVDASTIPSAVSIGDFCRLKENVWLAAYGGRIVIRDRVLIGRNCVFHGHGGIEVSEDVMFGPNVTVLTSSHGHAPPPPRFQYQGETLTPVRIGAGSWIGANAILLPGAEISEDVIVAAGSIIAGSLETGWIYASKRGIAVKVKKI